MYLFKRKRFLPNISSGNATMRGFDERNAINAPIQGSAADIIKLAMVNIHKKMLVQKMESKLLLQVHDELVLDMVKEEQKDLEEQHAGCPNRRCATIPGQNVSCCDWLHLEEQKGAHKHCNNESREGKSSHSLASSR